MCNRCYLRGLTPLGIFNTICGCLFNGVLVKVVNESTGKIHRRYWDRASDWKPEERTAQ